MIKETYIASHLRHDIIERYMIQHDDSAVLQWMFDGVSEDRTVLRKILSVYLTPEECDLLTHRNRIEEGILEPIRNNMVNTSGKIIFVQQGRSYSFSMVDYEVPRWGSEDEFVDSLLNFPVPDYFKVEKAA